ncbi:gp3 [Brochothrix phage BL3]|uniref:gp3 n=1 Tax=Brochothrix phage BL3 TaxID=764562 RepID=UPI0001D9ACC7|nr:gp3 [Brochothrix phage BL3]ADH03082.1 gp3 [Brochothrix phage BL3]
MMRKEIVQFVDDISPLTNTQKQEHVQELVGQNLGKVRVKKVEYVGKEDVYNMEVRDHHNYAVAGGFIIHNCIDATRYAFENDMTKRKATVANKSKFGF